MTGVNHWMKRCSLAALLLVAASHSGHAWAIDCSLATTQVDKAICVDPGLSNQDAQLNDDYRQAMAKLSPAGQSSLRDDQRNWLRYRGAACGFVEGDSHPGNATCLATLIRRRADQVLSPIAQQQGDLFRFYFKSAYVTTPDPSGGLPFWSESSIPQIDSNSLSPSLAWSDVQAWNALMVKLVGAPATSSIFCQSGKADIHSEPRFAAASVMLITVSENRDETCRRSRTNVYDKGPLVNALQDHFMLQTQYAIVVMRGNVHLLTAGDLFSSGDGWKRLLIERVKQQTESQASRFNPGWQPSADALERVATDPAHWIPGETFGIRVDPSDLSADQWIGGFTVEIPWSDLQGVLSFKGKRILSASNW